MVEAPGGEVLLHYLGPPIHVAPAQMNSVFREQEHIGG